MPPGEQPPSDLTGYVFEDCFDAYVGGECLTYGEAFLRHPLLMAWRILSYEPIVTALVVTALIGAVAAFRRWKKKKALMTQRHDDARA